MSYLHPREIDDDDKESMPLLTESDVWAFVRHDSCRHPRDTVKANDHLEWTKLSLTDLHGKGPRFITML